MSAAITLDGPITAALNDAIQPKLAEIGWSTGGADDSALAEYIILMLVNGKTQDQIAAELSGDLLNLGPDDPGAKEFSQWLFEQVSFLSQGQNGGAAQQNASSGLGQDGSADAGQDEIMGDASEAGDPNVPTGPKSMRSGAGVNRNRDRRMLGQLQKNLDGKDSILHRVRGHVGNERINSNARGAPTGPRGNMQQRGGRFGAMGMQGRAAASPMITPAQQMEMFRMMQQMFTPEQHASMMAGGNGQMPMGMPPYQQQNRNVGRSLFERVQQPNRRQNENFGPGQQFKNRTSFQHQQQQQPQVPAAPVSPMDMVLTPAHEPLSPDTTCKFNLACTNKDCKFAHQSPAAPPGTAIDVTDQCAFGAACKNRKCTARHPSPAQKVAHNAEQDCKFFPNCTNPRCPFRHPTSPLCRNGADCKDEGCTFTHVKTMCKFSPCLNPQCAFKHEDGQRRGKFEDKVWVAGEKKGGQHVSERKFVSDNNQIEELIIPGASDDTDVVT